MQHGPLEIDVTAAAVVPYANEDIYGTSGDHGYRRMSIPRRICYIYRAAREVERKGERQIEFIISTSFKVCTYLLFLGSYYCRRDGPLRSVRPFEGPRAMLGTCTRTKRRSAVNRRG